jgi:two-component system response regulator RegA
MSSTPGPILVIDDDAVFAAVLVRAFQRRGIVARAVHTAAEAVAARRALGATHVVLDLRLGMDNGLAVIDAVRADAPSTRILLLTGYASIATAVEAIRRGAVNYLAKPVDADQILRAFDPGDGPPVAPPERPLGVDRLEWEHIQRVLAEHDHNVAATARALGMHRRTLQRKLAKRPPRER